MTQFIGWYQEEFGLNDLEAFWQDDLRVVTSMASDALTIGTVGEGTALIKAISAGTARITAKNSVLKAFSETTKSAAKKLVVTH